MRKSSFSSGRTDTIFDMDEKTLFGRVPRADVDAVIELAQAEDLPVGALIRAMVRVTLANPAAALARARADEPERAEQLRLRHAELQALVLAIVASRQGVSAYRLEKLFGTAVRQPLKDLLDVGVLRRAVVRPGNKRLLALVDESAAPEFISAADPGELAELLNEIPERVHLPKPLRQRPVITDEQIRHQVFQAVLDSGVEGRSADALRKAVRGKAIRIDQAIADLELLGKVERRGRRIVCSSVVK